jgi:chaperonin cofactor prefoldin
MNKSLFNNMTLEELCKTIRSHHFNMYTHGAVLLDVLVEKVERHINDRNIAHEAEIEILEKEILDLESENQSLSAALYDLKS